MFLSIKELPKRRNSIFGSEEAPISPPDPSLQAEHGWKIKIKVISAAKFRTKSGQGDMNPYCEIIVGEFKNRTKLIYGHHAPVWNEKFDIESPDGVHPNSHIAPPHMDIRIMSKSKNKEKVVGKTDLDLKPLWISGQKKELTLNLLNGGMPSGVVNLIVKCTKDSCSKSPPGAPPSS